jgi:hypothetical protein
VPGRRRGEWSGPGNLEKHWGSFYDPGMSLPQYSPARGICSVHVALIQLISPISIKETTNILNCLNQKATKIVHLHNT